MDKKSSSPFSAAEWGGGKRKWGTEETKFCDEKDRTEGEREGPQKWLKKSSPPPQRSTDAADPPKMDDGSWAEKR